MWGLFLHQTVVMHSMVMWGLSLHQTVVMHSMVMWGLSLHQTVVMHCMVMWGLSLHQTVVMHCMVMWGLSLHQTVVMHCMVMWGLSPAMLSSLHNSIQKWRSEFCRWCLAARVAGWLEKWTFRILSPRGLCLSVYSCTCQLISSVQLRNATASWFSMINCSRQYRLADWCRQQRFSATVQTGADSTGFLPQRRHAAWCRQHRISATAQTCRLVPTAQVFCHCCSDSCVCRENRRREQNNHDGLPKVNSARLLTLV